MKLEGLIGKAKWSWEGGDREVRVQHERQEFKLILVVNVMQVLK